MYPQVFGKYVLERELARGGMARVVLATLRGAGGFEKKLVVKQIRDELASDDEFVRRFVEEAKTTVALAHPNIVPVYELGLELGTYFLAMEYVEGASLAEIQRACAQEGKRLTPEEGAYVGVEVCRALDYSHRRMNVVHRDVTPRNVMVDEEGQVKVIDFGISAPVATAPSGQGVFGSPGHMPPEQMDGSELTPAADVFAVAVLLMELWSGKPPFRRHTTEAVEKAMREPHPKPSDADPRLAPLDDVLSRAMALDPRSRPQQADDLSRALRTFLIGVDLGDVARQLGDRVRKLRESPLPPANEKKPILQRPPSRPSATDLGTKTFAARAEVGVWEAPQGTRRIVSDPPPPSSRPTGDAIETVATRPIETDPRDQKTGPVEAPRRGPASVAVGVGVAAGVAVAAFFIGRGAALGPAPVPLPAVTTTSAAIAPSAQPSSTAPPVPAPASAPGAPTSTAAAASAPLVERATLVLVGDGASVSLDGVGRGATPLRVAVEPGAHTVVFRFSATGESKGASVSVKPGERATLRADFTGASPSVRIER